MQHKLGGVQSRRRQKVAGYGSDVHTRVSLFLYKQVGKATVQKTSLKKKERRALDVKTLSVCAAEEECATDVFSEGDQHGRQSR